MKQTEYARNRRAGEAKALSAERISDAALAMIEINGLEAFSLRKLASHLGCEAMSLYHHFASKSDILNALTDRLIDGLPKPADEQPPLERLRKLAWDWRDLALAHPHFFRYLALHRLNSATGVRFLNAILQALREAGIPPESAARLFRVINYFLIGAALDETAGYAKGPSAQAPIDDATLARDFPALAEAAPFFTPDQFEKTFEFGLALLLDVP